MAINIGDNFSYKGSKHLDSRKEFLSIEEMKNYSEDLLPKVFYAFVGTDEYKYCIDNDFDEITGKWRLHKSKEEVLISNVDPIDEDTKLWIYNEEENDANDLLADRIIEEYNVTLQLTIKRMKDLEAKVAYLEQLIESGGVNGDNGDNGDSEDPRPPVVNESIKMKIETDDLLKSEDESLLTFEDTI